MVADSEEGDFKRCPDCAETIRAQARVCRFCGYRFESLDSSPSGARSPGEPNSVRELLGEWGATLGSQEEIAFFLPAHIRTSAGSDDLSADGFLLVTDRRLLFFASPRRITLRQAKPAAKIVAERRLVDLSEARAAGRWRRTTLQLSDGLEFSGFHPRSKLEEIRGYIAARARLTNEL
jgi:hypothetical protein